MLRSLIDSVPLPLFAGSSLNAVNIWIIYVKYLAEMNNWINVGFVAVIIQIRDTGRFHY